MRNSKLCILASLLSFALVLTSIAPGAAGAQSSVLPDEEEKEANDMRKLAARAKETEPFFASTEPFDVAITTNIRRIRADKEDKAPWRPATLTYTDAAGKKIDVPMRLRTRGIWRLKNCEFPPLRMNFRHEETKGTLLSGLDKPKLVNFCENADAHENYIIQEMQLYRIFNLLTPASHRARLLRVSYIDSASGKTHAKRMAILVEEPETMAARLGSPLVEIKGATTSDLDAYNDALVGVFQYMIGNTDWSTYALHNMELVREEDGDYIPIPYDFDFAGAIDAPYATPDPKLKLARVRQRLYRGFCHEEPEFQKVFSLFNEKKDAIYALYNDPIGRSLPKKTVAETLGYFDEFYQTINDSKRARNLIVDKCVKIR
jgi:hypothetical protein